MIYKWYPLVKIMVKPTLKQQERARTRIRQLITSRPTTKTRTQEKIRLGKKLGYSGKDSNIARSVDRLITRDRDSVSARNLSDVKQVKAIDRAWYSRTRNIDFILERNQSLSVLPYVPAILTYDDFIDNDRNVWTTRNVPRVLFRDKTGVVFGDIYVILQIKVKNFQMNVGYILNTYQKYLLRLLLDI